ncbi:MAG: DUF1414 domain-containing protein [Glaciecola sp.]|jgi:uncharacterized protein|uniref:DUF1414 domain-containing protein n=1 Tax=Glaciecola sp. HTCC2999 TaxID=455436 RepID=UPI0000E0FA01|nr:DUF1414 domain-containing protein [Glaciecola sp. HTCC2999]
MPQQSQYNDAQFEVILNDVLACLEKHQATRDLSLMVLGNAVTHIFSHQVDERIRTQMVEQFCSVLTRSVKG